jgi:hypothetical protein
MRGLRGNRKKPAVRRKALVVSGDKTLATATSLGGPGATVRFSLSNPIRLVYTDPDGMADEDTITGTSDSHNIVEIRDYTAKITDTNNDGQFDINNDEIEFTLDKGISTNNPDRRDAGDNKAADLADNFKEYGYRESSNPPDADEKSISVINQFTIDNYNAINRYRPDSLKRRNIDVDVKNFTDIEP